MSFRLLWLAQGCLHKGAGKNSIRGLVAISKYNYEQHLKTKVRAQEDLTGNKIKMLIMTVQTFLQVALNRQIRKNIN